MRQLGQLEAKVMEIVWAADEPLSVRDLHSRMAEDGQRAYTTVMTVMDNLFRKGLLTRELVGKAYQYRAATTRAAHTATAMEELLAASGSSTSTLLHFVGQLSSEDALELRRALDAAVDRETS